MPDRYYQEKHFVEDISLFFEQMGLPRMAGRILGVLLISGPPEQSINDLCEVLQASKSSISTNARLLTETGLIERVKTSVNRLLVSRDVRLKKMLRNISVGAFVASAAISAYFAYKGYDIYQNQYLNAVGHDETMRLKDEYQGMDLLRNICFGVSGAFLGATIYFQFDLR